MIWPTFDVKQLMSLEYGRPLPKGFRNKNGIYPVAGSNGIDGYHDEWLVEGPGIVVGRKGSAGKVTWFESNFWPIDTTYFVRHAKCCNKRWVYYFLLYSKISDLATMTGVPGLNRNDVYRLRISLPPLSEQQRIVDILDQADVLRKMRAEADEMMQRVLPALFYKMFGDPATNLKNWNTVSFQEAFKDDTSRCNKLLKTEYQASGLYPVIDQGKTFIAGYFDSDSFVVRSSKPVIVFGDHTRAIKLIDFPFIAGADGSRILSVKDGLCPEFLACQLELLPIPDLGYSRHMREVKRLQFTKPPINLQNQFAVYYRNIRSTCNNQETSKGIIESLMHTLLHHAFSSELTAKWREAHMKELLQEMEVQTRELGFLVHDEDHSTRMTDFLYPLLEKKSILLAYIILRSLEAKHQIARVKLAKQYYFVNQFMQQPVTEYFQPMAAGPLDNDIFAALELAQDRKWVVIEPQKGNEKPLSAGVCIADTEKLVNDILGPTREQVDDYLESTKDWGWETLERWATVHSAALKLVDRKIPLTLESVKLQIRSIPEWEAKLKRSEFSDVNIEKALIGLKNWSLLPI